MSECAKALFDILRRYNQALTSNINNIQNKPFICVAAAGGSGNGTLSCLSNNGKTISAFKQNEL